MSSNVQTFTELLRESTLVQAIITCFLMATICLQILRGDTPNSELVSIFNLIIGYYFGVKSNMYASNMLRKVKETIEENATTSKFKSPDKTTT